MHERISKAENDSYEICEQTGKPGVLRTDIGWYTTLCDEEYQKVLERRKK
jgi:RNA polymerase-binding transcription factor DksA